MALSSIKAPQSVLDLLSHLHKESLDQEVMPEQPNGAYQQISEQKRSDLTAAQSLHRNPMQDKFDAPAADKASFVYNVIRGPGALNVCKLAQAGTSYGVNTMHIALAVGRNDIVASKLPGSAKVVATEHEPETTQKACEYCDEAGELVID